MADRKSNRTLPNRTPVEDREVPAEALHLEVNVARLGFTTTAELEPLDGLFGQHRALRALELGLGVRQHGYNVYLSGAEDVTHKDLVCRLLQDRAQKELAPDDWVYVHNFDEPDRPLVFRLPAGHGVRLRAGLEHLIERVRQDLPAALKAKDFDTEQDRLGAKYSALSETLFQDLVERGRRLSLHIRRLPNGSVIFVPMKNGQPLDREQVEALSPAEREEYEQHSKELGEQTGAILERQQELFRQMRDEVQALIRARAIRIIDPLLAQIRAEHPPQRLAAWLDRIRAHLLDNLEALENLDQEPPYDLKSMIRAEHSDPLLVYRVNVVADNSHSHGAPVVFEPVPNYKNLFGTIEQDVNLFGRLSTNFTRIKPGSLLRANGGYLVFDLADALTEPLVWKQLKRTLKCGQLLTDIYEPLALLSSAALKPEPIPLDIKAIVLGPARLFYLLQMLDHEFGELFKVRADFGPEVDRDVDSERSYARFIACTTRDKHLPPFDADAVAEVIRDGARRAGHRDRLSLELEPLGDLIYEAGYWAGKAGARVVEAGHVRQALSEHIHRNDRLAEVIRQLIREGTLKIALSGRQVGQINGLSMLDLGDFRFGRPSRVSASVGIGREGLINIERESELSGSTHDKGVLILEGYLRNRYARRHPLALSASLAFEQSYGWIEGDSASAAELFCLLSALGGVPLRQDVAVTGSVNQHGEIQAVGGINEKVEGFFDVCSVAGLTGTQGVCLPRSNLIHLLPRADVIEAVRQGQFHIWAIDHVDEGLELLTGLPSGDVDLEGTFHHRLDQRLGRMLAVLRDEQAGAGSAHIHLGGAEPPAPLPPPLPGGIPERAPACPSDQSGPRNASNAEEP